MDARPFLIAIAEALDDVGLEAILVGNAAAALHGAPVSTLDFDFMFRKTPTNLAKLKKLADRLDAVILRPYYPTSDLYRVTVEDTGLQLDFMSVLHGVRSFASLRSRAEQVAFGRARLWVANLDDVIAMGSARPQRHGRSERSEAEPRNLPAPTPIEERCLDRLGMTRSDTSAHGARRSGQRCGQHRRDRLERLKAETEQAELEQIRRLLDLPMDQRTHFLRRRTGFIGSAL